MISDINNLLVPVFSSDYLFTWNYRSSIYRVHRFNTTILRDMKNSIHINLPPQRTTKNSMSRVASELASSGF